MPTRCCCFQSPTTPASLVRCILLVAILAVHQSQGFQSQGFQSQGFQSQGFQSQGAQLTPQKPAAPDASPNPRVDRVRGKTNSAASFDSRQIHPPPTHSGNRHAYLDYPCDPYYPSRTGDTRFQRPPVAALTTPQWIGEPGVEAVVTLGIDDMRDTARYEAYLRPILDRLKKIDGRAPVSIMTCSVDPNDPQLKKWLREGLSLECHTVDHPCPCLQGADFDKAKDTYDRCVDMMTSIPGNQPVAFRFPCMDSLNTPSPRAYAEILGRKTNNGNFLQVSSSVTCLFTNKDASLNAYFQDRPERFRRYIPFPSFVNRIDNYPYPYVIGGKIWEFPCTIPDDWQGQNIQRPNNPETVADLKAALEATVAKQGVANIVFHPHGWIRAEQMVDVIDHIDKTYGGRVKFLTFRECVDKINRFLLDGHSLRAAKTGDSNGVRLLDLNLDGWMDVFIGSETKKLTRIWDPKAGSWQDTPHDLLAERARFGIVGERSALLQQVEGSSFQLHLFDATSGKWTPSGEALQLPAVTSVAGIRLRDLNLDGQCELIVGTAENRSIFAWTVNHFQRVVDFPAKLVDKAGRDNGARFVDLDGDQYPDLIQSNDTTQVVYLYDPDEGGFRQVKLGTELPRIVHAGSKNEEAKNNGAWFAENHLWVQNEHTHRLPDGVDRRHFHEILAEADPNPRTPEVSLKSIQTGADFVVELMVAEPLVQDPIFLEWGADGKLWVVEMADYPLGIDDQGKPGGRVRYLEDTDGDGRYDRSTLFVTGIPFPTSVLPINTDPSQPACLITAAPYLLKANRPGTWEDLLVEEGDESTPSRRILLQGFGEGNQQHRFNGFAYGLDNWIYLANGDSGGLIESPQSGNRFDIRGRDLRIRLGDTLQVQPQTGQTQFGRHRDDWGNWFGNSNPLPIRHYGLADHYLARNPNFRYPSPRNDLARADNTQLFPRSRVLSHWSGYRPPADGQPHRFTSACGTNFYRDRLWPDSESLQAFTCEPVHNLVHRRTLIPDGLTFKSERPKTELDREFLASSDSWFRPTSVTTGPDGAIWITDMYRLVIEHPEWIDDQREKELFLRAGHDRGRIYRVRHRNQVLRELPHTAQKQLPQAKTWLQWLQSPNRWYRETGQRMLVEAKAASTQKSSETKKSKTKKSLEVLASEHSAPLTRLHAVCTLEGRNELEASLLRKLLRDPHPGVRRHAVRLSESFLKAAESELDQDVCRLWNDPDPHVRQQVAYSLGFSEAVVAHHTLAKMGGQSWDVPWLNAAIFSSLNRSNISTILTAVEKSSDRIAGSEYHLALLEQAMRMGHSERVSDSLGRILSNWRSQSVSTKQLQSLGALLTTLPENHEVSQTVADQLREFISELLATNADGPQKTSAVRVAGLQVLAVAPFLDPAERVEQILRFVDSSYDVTLQTSAVELLGKSDQPGTATALANRFRNLSPAVRNAIVATVANRKTWAFEFLGAISEKKLPAAEISKSQRRTFALHPNPEIRKRARQLLTTNLNSNRRAVFDNYRKQVRDDEIEKLRSNGVSLERGAKTFQQHCSKCHRLTDQGKAIGPDLRAVKDRSVEAFLKAILEPNAAVEDKYRNFVFALEDGRELSGMIVSETAASLQIATADGKQIDLLRSEVEALKSTRNSFMPVGLEAEISAEEMLHLLNFLLSSAPELSPPKTFSGNRPGKIVQSDSTKITLPATACEIRGPSLVFESKYKNLGFWGHTEDSARWKLEVKTPGKYEVWLDHALPDNASGNTFSIKIADQVLEGRTSGTGTWDNYRQKRFGVLPLPAGTVTVEMSALKPLKGPLLDLRAIELRKK